MRKIFFAVILFLTACNSSQPTLNDCVRKNWHYVSAKDEQGNDFKKVSSADILSLTANNFKYDIEQENIHASGTWELKDSTLVFTYNPSQKVRYFRITTCSGDSLVFVENGIIFTFSDKNP